MTLPEPDGLLFDLDGTLVESMPDLRDTLDGALKHHGGVEVQTEQILNWIGDGVHLGVGCRSRWSLPPMKPCAASAPHVPRDVPRRLLPEVVLALWCARTVGRSPVAWIAMAICTNKDDMYTMPLLLHGPVEVLLGGEVPGPTVARKPDADMLQQAMQELGERPWMMGDSRADAFAAKNAGVPCILPLRGMRRESSLEDYGVELVVDEVSQITERLRGSLAIS